MSWGDPNTVTPLKYRPQWQPTAREFGAMGETLLRLAAVAYMRPPLGRTLYRSVHDGYFGPLSYWTPDRRYAEFMGKVIGPAEGKDRKLYTLDVYGSKEYVLDTRAEFRRYPQLDGPVLDRLLSAMQPLIRLQGYLGTPRWLLFSEGVAGVISPDENDVPLQLIYLGEDELVPTEVPYECDMDAYQRLVLGKVMAALCDLCRAARTTRWFHEDTICWVAKCDTCAVPMVVWRQHGTAPSDADRSHMHQRLAAVATEQFKSEPFLIDDHMRKIPNHYHAHARPMR